MEEARAEEARVEEVLVEEARVEEARVEAARVEAAAAHQQTEPRAAISSANKRPKSLLYSCLVLRVLQRWPLPLLQFPEERSQPRTRIRLQAVSTDALASLAILPNTPRVDRRDEMKKGDTSTLTRLCNALKIHDCVT